MFEIITRDGDTFIGYAPSWRAADMQVTLYAQENRMPRGRLQILFPPDYPVPVILPGGERAVVPARETALPLTGEPF